ncbi:MAG: hypothetical protein JWN37_464 [Candidatus Nomurabacteria bacterium]|nr:hypothetical protein [Candidatus Nomurabacteria bacterium]
MDEIKIRPPRHHIYEKTEYVYPQKRQHNKSEVE